MRAIVRAVIVTAITGALMYVFVTYTHNRAQQAIFEGWDLSQGFRIQIGVANLLSRFWWFLLPFFGLSYWLIFHLLSDETA
jgi:hypothetical protein